MKLLKAMKSNEFALYVAIASVLVQSFHTYIAFYNISSIKGTFWGSAQAIIFAGVLDMAILFYTLRNKRGIALMFAVAMVLINAYYYYQHLGFSFQFWFGVFISLLLPVSVYFYSEEIVDDDAPTENETRYIARIDELTKMNDQVYSELKAAKSIISEGTKENKKFSEMIDKLRGDYDEAIRLRDLAVQSESMTKHAFDKYLRAQGESLPDDKSLLNIQPDRSASKISSTLTD